MRKWVIFGVLMLLAFVLAACFGGGGSRPKPPQPTTFKVSGTIKDNDENPIEGVTVSVVGTSTTKVATTDASGEWEASDLTGEVKVTPAHDDYTFDPASQTANQNRSNMDFTGTNKVIVDPDPDPDPALEYAVRGTVTKEDGDPISNVTIRILVRGAEKTTTTRANGTWEMAGLSGEVIVSAFHAEFEFSPPLTVTEEHDNVNFTGTQKMCTSGSRSDPLDPCVLTSVEQLQRMSDDLGGHYALGADIIALSTSSWHNGEGFDPVGSSASAPFAGTLDGRDYVITGLTINRGGHHGVGLFGYIGTTGVVRNMALENWKIHGGEYVGALVGSNEGHVEKVRIEGMIEGDRHVGGVAGRNGGTIINSHNSGSVTGDSDVGGLTGQTWGPLSSVKSSYNTGDVTGNSSVGGVTGYLHEGNIDDANNTGNIEGLGHVGGIVGMVDQEGTITDSHSVATVKGSASSVGGLIGQIRNGTVTGSSSDGSVAGGVFVGGLVGDHSKGTISGSYSAGSVEGGNSVGGLVGINFSSITDSYSTAQVEGEEQVGGLVGSNSGESSITDSNSTGQVRGQYMVGGLVGANFSDGKVTHSQSEGTVYGNDRTGGLIGYNTGLVTDSSSTSDVHARDRVGGLVGRNSGGSITRSNSTGEVTGQFIVGGLVGVNDDDGEITYAHSKGDVYGNDRSGGLVGYNRGLVTRSFSTSVVDARDRVGGLIGFNEEGEIRYAYSIGSVIGRKLVGGLIGDNFEGKHLLATYSVGSVTGDEDVGGLVGRHSGVSGASFYEFDSAGAIGSATGTAQSKQEMQDRQTYESEGWDFRNVWRIAPSDYPELRGNHR